MSRGSYYGGDTVHFFFSLWPFPLTIAMGVHGSKTNEINLKNEMDRSRD